MKRVLLSLLIFLSSLSLFAQSAEVWKSLEKPLNFLVTNDTGRNGYYDQKEIAATMGSIGEAIDIECVVAPGDVHHFEGVRSVEDPLWMTNYELIYDHPELMIPWYTGLGNHEYRGNSQAPVDYTSVSGRWNMPSKYYTEVVESDDVTIRIIMLDTCPMIEKYRNNEETYPDASKENYKKQLRWLDKVLSSAAEDWVIVFGHHPVYAQTDKSESERRDMQDRLNPVLKAHDNVEMYICGHIHSAQHIRMPDSDIDYIVNTSGSLSRDVSPIEGTVFCSPLSGFSLISADKSELKLYMMDKTGTVIHTVTREK